VSETVQDKEDLLGYCATHGDERRNVWPERTPEEKRDAK